MPSATRYRRRPIAIGLLPPATGTVTGTVTATVTTTAYRRRPPPLLLSLL